MTIVHFTMWSGDQYSHDCVNDSNHVSIGELLRAVATHWDQFIWNITLLDLPSDRSWTVEDADKQLVLHEGQVFHVFFQEHPFLCWIRYHHMDIWQPARIHHVHALDQFLRVGDRSVCVPHESGGMFRATFVEDSRRPSMDTTRVPPQYINRWQYVDEYHRTVDIMRSTPEFVGYINRITS